MSGHGGDPAADAPPIRRGIRTRSWLDQPPLLAVAQRVAAALKDVSRYEQVGRFVLAAQPLTIDSGHLTPTLKIRRGKVYATFEDRIDALYAASTDGPVN